MEFKVGDIVETKKGCRYAGPPGKLIILEVNRKWRQYDAVVCSKLGPEHLFLCKNLFKADDVVIKKKYGIL